MDARWSLPKEGDEECTEVVLGREDRESFYTTQHQRTLNRSQATSTSLPFMGFTHKGGSAAEARANLACRKTILAEQ